jgi:hypothetical protein
MSIANKMTLGLLLAGTGLLGSSCADNDSTLFIYGVIDINRSQCVASPDAGSVLLASGVMDRLFANGYEAAILVGSHLTERGSREKLRTETSRLTINGAQITLYGTNGAAINVDSAATGLVNPASGTDPGLAAVFARIVRPEDMEALGPDGQIIARIKVLGTTLGGQEIESAEFDYPITICNGCLVSYPTESLDATGKVCVGGDTMMSQTQTVCSLGQDSPVNCSYCASYNEACLYWEQNPYYSDSAMP